MPFPRITQALQGGVNQILGRTATPSPYLSPEEQAAAAQQRRMAMAASLLQSARPMPQGTGPGVFGALGAALQAGNQTQDEAVQAAIRMRMLQAQMAQLSQGEAEPADVRTMRALGYSLNPEGFKSYNEAQSRPSTTINVGDEMNKPIPIAQLDTVRLPNGQSPPIGTTYAQARDMGAKVLSAAEQQRTVQADQALGILNQLETLAVGPEGVFNTVMPGLANRVTSALEFGFDMIEQKDPRASRFADMSQATLAPFIKFLGESGALAQGDVERALGLLPRIFPLPDTKEVATEKLAALREIIGRGVSKLNATKTQEIPPPPPGFTVDPEE